MPPADQRQFAAEQPSWIQSIAVKSPAPFFSAKVFHFLSSIPKRAGLWWAARAQLAAERRPARLNKSMRFKKSQPLQPETM